MEFIILMKLPIEISITVNFEFFEIGVPRLSFSITSIPFVMACPAGLQLKEEDEHVGGILYDDLYLSTVTFGL